MGTVYVHPPLENLLIQNREPLARELRYDCPDSEVSVVAGSRSRGRGHWLVTYTPSCSDSHFSFTIGVSCRRMV